MISREDIIKAWVILRESTKAQSIPSETLDLIKNASLDMLDRVNKFGDKISLEEAVNKNGWYVDDNFSKGVCMEVYRGEVKIVTFKDKDDINPTREPLSLYADLFNKKFKRIFNRKELFE